jgi:DNA-directed RNA polymerase specialized sigma24 family protein
MTDATPSVSPGAGPVRVKPNLVLVRCRGAPAAGLRFQREIDLALSAVPDLTVASRLGRMCERLEEAVHQPGPDTGVPLAFRLGLLDAVPALRRFSSCRWTSLRHIDDAVHAALLRAWASRRRFVPGTALLPWLLINLRLHSHVAGLSAPARYGTPGVLESAGLERLAQATFYEALWTLLDVPQREAMALVAGLHLQPRDAARILGQEQSSVVRHLRRAETILAEAWS